MERVCDHVAIINKGKTVAAGSIKQILAKNQQSTFEIEFEEDPGPMAKLLAGLPWVKAMSGLNRGERRVFQVDVSDVSVAKKELFRLVYESGLTPLRYEFVSASLEDVFIEMMGEQEVKA